ncbi:MAG: sensor histidine kinase [Myxococcota bacterium]
MSALAIGLRGRLFLVSVALMAGAVAAAGLYLEPRLVGWVEERTWSDLLHRADTARLVVEHTPTGRLQILAARLSGASGGRVTLVAPDGRKLGDSLIPSPDRVDGPEIEAAFRGDVGRDRRTSASTGVETLFLAVPWPRIGGRGAIRVAVPAATLEHAAGTVRALLIVGALVGLAVAALMSGLATSWFARWLRSLVARVRDAVDLSGAEAGRVRDDDLGGLAGTVGRMAAELERTVVSLAVERGRFEAVVEALDEGVVATDDNGTILVANTTARHLLDLPDDAEGRALLGFVRAPTLVALTRAARGGDAETRECRIGTRDERIVMARAAPLRRGGGVVLALRDVTNLRHLEGVRRDFVANVSHEIRTPISVIRANAETLLDGALEDPQAARAFTDAIHRHADRLSRLVEDLLDLARIESGRLDLSPRRLELAVLVRGVVEDLRPVADERRHALAVEIPEDLAVRGDPEALDHALSNLVDNALQYTPPGGQVTVRARPADGAVRVEVVDDGPGIPAQQRDRIFERFYRVDPGRSRDRGGTGLGLSIVKHLVTAMGGSVGVEVARPDASERPGSVFWFTLPAA